MTFKQILEYVKRVVREHRNSYNKNLIVTTKRGVSQYRRQFNKYKKECETLMKENNFDMLELDNYKKECEVIEVLLNNSIIYK